MGTRQTETTVQRKESSSVGDYSDRKTLISAIAVEELTTVIDVVNHWNLITEPDGSSKMAAQSSDDFVRELLMLPAEVLIEGDWHGPEGRERVGQVR